MKKLNKQLLWIYILSASVYFTQGIEGLPGMGLFFYLKEKLHFSPSTIMYIGSITGLAWLIKPLWGYLCDNHLTKKKWILISLLGSMGICTFLGLSPIVSIPLLVIMLSLNSWTAAVRDVAVDGIMCVEGKEANECGRIQAIQWTAITIASIIVGLIGGHIADHYSYKLAFLFLIPILLGIVAIVSMYKPLQKNVQKPTNDCMKCKFALECTDNSRTCNNFKLNLVTIKKLSLWQNICSYKELFTDKRFLIGCLFVFLYNFSPSFGTPLSFIERDVFKWSGTFMGTLGALASAVSIAGSIAYFKWGKKINVRKVLTWSVFLGAATTLSYLYFTPVSAIVYSFIYSIVGMFIFLNIMAWMAEATIKGKEATSFALLCSVNNLAGTASSLAGAYLFPKIGLSPLIWISALTSFACLPLIKYIGKEK